MEKKNDKKDNGKEKDNNKYNCKRQNTDKIFKDVTAPGSKVSAPQDQPSPNTSPLRHILLFFGDNLPLHRSKGNRPRLYQSVDLPTFLDTFQKPRKCGSMETQSRGVGWTLCRLSTDKQNLDNTEKVKVELLACLFFHSSYYKRCQIKCHHWSLKIQNTYFRYIYQP